MWNIGTWYYLGKQSGVIRQVVTVDFDKPICQVVYGFRLVCLNK